MAKDFKKTYLSKNVLIKIKKNLLKDIMILEIPTFLFKISDQKN